MRVFWLCLAFVLFVCAAATGNAGWLIVDEEAKQCQCANGGDCLCPIGQCDCAEHKVVTVPIVWTSRKIAIEENVPPTIIEHVSTKKITEPIEILPQGPQPIAPGYTVYDTYSCAGGAISSGCSGSVSYASYNGPGRRVARVGRGALRVMTAPFRLLRRCGRGGCG